MRLSSSFPRRRLFGSVLLSVAEFGCSSTSPLRATAIAVSADSYSRHWPCPAPEDTVKALKIRALRGLS